MSGSSMQMVNQVCNPCTVPVTGSITLEDDEAGNILLTDVTLAHAGYQVGAPIFVSVIIERTLMALGAGSVAGAGSTLGSNVLFGTTDLAQTGTTTCTSGAITCAAGAGLPEGVTPLPGLVPGLDLGSWAFDALRNLTSASVVYTDTTTPSPALETLVLVGTVVPEPGTALLLGAGLVGLALRRRARA